MVIMAKNTKSRGNREEIDESNENYSNKSRIDQIQEEFGMSDSEMDDISKFTSSLSNDIKLPDVLEELIKYESLNIRQKVAFAHMLGIFRAEGNRSPFNNRAIIIEGPEFEK